MPTVHEILKASGFSDAKIAALDADAMKAFEGVILDAENQKKAGLDAVAKAQTESQSAAAELTKAQKAFDDAKKAQEAAELAQRSNVEFYETKITPALSGWEQQKKDLEIAKANFEAKSAFLEKQVEGAKAAGFLPADAPAFVMPTPSNNPAGNPEQQRDAQGRFVVGAPGGTPGSPTYMTPEQMAARAADGLNMIADIQAEYQMLFGKPMPILPSQLVAQADQLKLDPKTYATRTFNFENRRAEIAAQAKEAERQQIAAEATKPLQDEIAQIKKQNDETMKQKEREWAEKYGSNPDVRIPQAARVSDIARAVKNNERPDPLNLDPNQRRQATTSAIRTEIAQNSAA